MHDVFGEGDARSLVECVLVGLEAERGGGIGGRTRHEGARLAVCVDEVRYVVVREFRRPRPHERGVRVRHLVVLYAKHRVVTHRPLQTVPYHVLYRNRVTWLVIY